MFAVVPKKSQRRIRAGIGKEVHGIRFSGIFSDFERQKQKESTAKSTE